MFGKKKGGSLFFSWYLENKHFKQGNNLSGQIIPFLLIVLVILLIAAIAVIQIGRISIDKTYSSNAADAGALAAASIWATSLNNLAYKNYDLRSNFDKYRGAIKNKFIPEANYFLTQSALYGKAAQQNTMLGSTYVTAAGILSMIPGGGICGAVPFHFAAAGRFNNAQTCANESLNNLRSYQIMIDLMKASTQAFQDSQIYKYQEIRKNMIDAHVAAKKEGFQYAFSNSGIQNKLSKVQGDQFNYFLAKTLPDSIAAGVENAVFSWEDKNNKSHSVSVTLSLPDIEKYTLRKTKDLYSYTQFSYDTSRNTAQKIISDVGTQVVALSMAWGTAMALFALSTTACAVLLFPVFGLAASSILSIIAKAINYIFVGTLVILIASMVATWFGQKSDPNAPTLRLMVKNALLDESWEYAGNDPGKDNDYLFDSINANDAEIWMIASIEDINRNLGDDFWKTKCCVSQTHPRIDLTTNTTYEYVTTQSCSVAQFSGGSMKLTPYTPSCEAEWKKEQDSREPTSLERTLVIRDFLDTNFFKTVDFKPWIGSSPTNPCGAWLPPVTEEVIEKTVNANYTPLIVDVN